MKIGDLVNRKIPPSSVGDCDLCKKPILGVHGDDVRTVSEKPVHEDCYFNALGDLIEQYPIGRPRKTSHQP